MTEHHLKIMLGVKDHWEESLQYFSMNNIVGIFLQGSQNYNLDTPNSDIDTKLIVTPSFSDIAFNRKAVSTTHVRENNEHIDFKDIRLYIETFRKQNLNFLEILFTPYYIINPTYRKYWSELVKNRELITHYNPYRSVKSMKGIAMEKYHAFDHPYPSKMDVLAKWGYDPKQLHHLIRVSEYLQRYINGEKYEDCLISNMPEYLIDVKNGCYNRKDALEVRERIMKDTLKLTDDFCEKTKETTDPQVDELFGQVQYEVMKESVWYEFNS